MRNPFRKKRNWRVEHTGWFGGRYEDFVGREKALEAAQRSTAPFVDLIDLQSGARERLREDKRTPIVEVDGGGVHRYVGFTGE